jgi:hypothetical protein
MKPLVNTLILCDYSIYERDSGKPSVLGIFTNIIPEKFPHNQLCMLYVNLTNGHGKCKCCIRIENQLSGEIIFNLPTEVDFKDPKRGIDVMIRLMLQINSPGPYMVNFLCEGEIAKSIKLDILNKEEIKTNGL